jgi:hypothetical protein
MSDRTSPVFILGIQSRSGTNFLHRLLCLHPDCRASVLPEDHFVERLPELKRLSVTLQEREYRKWLRADVAGDLNRAFGAALVEYLVQHASRCPHSEVEHAAGEDWYREQSAPLGSLAEAGRARLRLVTKTPSVAGLPCFFEFFPSCPLVILVRDGRAIAQSAHQGFGHDLEGRIRDWAEAAQQITQFVRATEPERYRIVHYENLVSFREEELRSLLSFLQLDEHLYPWEDAARLPVRGSSFVGKKHGEVSWDAVPVTPEFRPLERAVGWPDELVELYERIAGEAARQLGYDDEVVPQRRIACRLSR